MIKKIYKYLMILQGFIGLGGLAGGTGAICDPTGKSMGISVDVLKYGPFNDFLIPGLFLFFIIGIGNIVCAIFAYFKSNIQAYISGVFSFILVMWIVIQCYILNDINILHVIYFIFGLIGLVLSIILAFKQKLFPTKIIINIFNKK